MFLGLQPWEAKVGRVLEPKFEASLGKTLRPQIKTEVKERGAKVPVSPSNAFPTFPPLLQSPVAPLLGPLGPFQILTDIRLYFRYSVLLFCFNITASPLISKEITNMTEFWLISAPGEKTCQQTWEKLHAATTKNNNLAVSSKFNIPDLKVRLHGAENCSWGARGGHALFCQK